MMHLKLCTLRIRVLMLAWLEHCGVYVIPAMSSLLQHLWNLRPKAALSFEAREPEDHVSSGSKEASGGVHVGRCERQRH
jgi:hypothetical protein